MHFSSILLVFTFRLLSSPGRASHKFVGLLSKISCVIFVSRLRESSTCICVFKTQTWGMNGCSMAPSRYCHGTTHLLWQAYFFNRIVLKTHLCSFWGLSFWGLTFWGLSFRGLSFQGLKTSLTGLLIPKKLMIYYYHQTVIGTAAQLNGNVALSISGQWQVKKQPSQFKDEENNPRNLITWLYNVV